MSNFKMQHADPTGVLRFLQSVVVATVGKVSKNVNDINATYARDLSYIAMAIGEDSSVYLDKTKREAGKACLAGLQGTPKEAVFSFMLPTKYDDRNATNDPAKFTTVIKVTQPDMLTVAQALAKVNDIMVAVEAQTAEVVTSASKATATEVNPMPVYFAGSKVATKRAGGSKEHAPITFA